MVCRVLANVCFLLLLLLRTDSEADSWNNGGVGVTKRNFTLTNGQAYFVTLKDSCWDLVMNQERRGEEEHRFREQSKSVFIQETVLAFVEFMMGNESSVHVNETWIVLIRTLSNPTANWGRWFIVTGLAKFFHETPHRRCSPLFEVHLQHIW